MPYIAFESSFVINLSRTLLPQCSFLFSFQRSDGAEAALFPVLFSFHFAGISMKALKIIASIAPTAQTMAILATESQNG